MISVIVHLFLLLILLSPCFSFINKEQPPESGIYVALGNPQSEMKTKSQSSKAVQKSTPQKAKTKTTKPSASKPKPTPRKSTERIKSEVVQEKSNILASKVELDKKKQEEAQREQKEKALREKEEAERQQREAEENARKAAEEAKRKAKQDAKSKFSSLLDSSDKNGKTSKGQEHGKPDAKVLEGLTTGYGQTGEGLGDRKLLFAPTINDSSQKKGRVVVKICVGKSGKVTKAKYTQRGSTTTDSYLISLAEKSAKEYKFEKSTITEQCGDIIIDFKLK